MTMLVVGQAVLTEQTPVQQQPNNNWISYGIGIIGNRMYIYIYSIFIALRGYRKNNGNKNQNKERLLYVRYVHE